MITRWRQTVWAFALLAALALVLRSPSVWHEHDEGQILHSHGHLDHQAAFETPQSDATTGHGSHAGPPRGDPKTARLHGHIHFSWFGVTLTVPWPEKGSHRVSNLDRELVAKYAARRATIEFTTAALGMVPALVPACDSSLGRSLNFDWDQLASRVAVFPLALTGLMIPERPNQQGCDRAPPLCPPPRPACRG